MGQTPRTMSCGWRFLPAIFLILFFTCLVMTASAATTGRSVPITTTSSPLQPSIALATTPPQTVTCQAPCSCMEPARAEIAWGAGGFTQCAEMACGYGYTAAGAPIEKYCLKQKTVTVRQSVSILPRATTTLTTIVTPAGRIPVTITTATAIPRQVIPKKETAPETILPVNKYGTGSAECQADQGKGKGLPDTENETTCQTISEDIPMKRLTAEDLGEFFEAIKNDPGLLQQWETHPDEAVHDYNLRLSEKQVTLLAGIPAFSLRNGFEKLSQSTQEQLKAAGSGPGNDMASSISYGEVCTTHPAPDGVPDICDNCPTEANPGQEDADSDGRGDACDNCPAGKNADQADSDFDNTGDACDICPGEKLY